MPKFIKSTVYLKRNPKSQDPYPVAVILGRPSRGEWAIQVGEFPGNADGKKLTKAEASKVATLVEALTYRFSGHFDDLFDNDFLNVISGKIPSGSKTTGLVSQEDIIAPFTLSEPETIIIPSIEAGFKDIFGDKSDPNNPVPNDSEKLAKDYENNSLEQESNNNDDWSGEDVGSNVRDNVKQLFGKNKDNSESTFPESTFPELYPPELTHKQLLAKELVDTGFQIASLIDKAMEVAAEPFLDRLHKDNEKKALKDPTYAEIERRRRTNGHHILFADEFDLGMEELRIQREILDKVSLTPWWEKPLKAVSRAPLTGLLSKARWLYQRATRSWDDTELWSLDTSFTKRLGEQLIGLSLHTHGWPGEENGYPTSEEWVDALNMHGHALRQYSIHKHDLAFYDSPNGEAKYAELHSNAKKALAWVAENLELLWD